MASLRYLQAYPAALQQQVRELIAQGRLGEHLSAHYPGRHAVQSDKAFYQLCQYMLPDYHQREFDLRVYLTWRDLPPASIDESSHGS